MSSFLFRETKEAAAAVFAHVNDIYSFNKEKKIEYSGNLIAQLLRYYNCGLQKAAELVGQIVHKELVNFEKLSSELLSRFPDQNKKIDCYLQVLMDVNMANYKFCLSDPRYKVSNDEAKRLIR